MSEGRTRGTGKPVATVVAVTVLVLAIAASAVASRFIPAAGPTPTESTSPGIGSAGPGPSGTSTIKWFVGLGGTSPARLAAEEAFAARYNASNKDGVILEIDDPRAIDPTADPVTILKTQFSANDGPDIVGPASLGAMSDFDGLWMDLTTEIAKDHVDLGSYDPALLKLAHEPGAYDTTPSGAPLTGIPYAVDPGFIVYNRDLFTRAGLPPLPTTVGQTYQGKTWDWNELAAVAARLTLDTSGRAAGQPGFDPAHIAQFGFDFPTSDARVMASTFGSGSLLAGFCPSDLQIAPTWSAALHHARI